MSTENQQEKISSDYTNNVTCPYCGHEEMDSNERRYDQGEETCDHCGQLFIWNRNIEITYSTEKKEQ